MTEEDIKYKIAEAALRGEAVSGILDFELHRMRYLNDPENYPRAKVTEAPRQSGNTTIIENIYNQISRDSSVLVVHRYRKMEGYQNIPDGDLLRITPRANESIEQQIRLKVGPSYYRPVETILIDDVFDIFHSNTEQELDRLLQHALVGGNIHKNCFIYARGTPLNEQY